MQTLWEWLRGEGLVVVAVSLDRGDRVRALALAEELGLEFPFLLDPDGRIDPGYDSSKLPVTYIIGRDGRFVAKLVGSRDWTSPAAVAWIRQLLKANPVERVTEKTRVFAGEEPSRPRVPR